MNMSKVRFCAFGGQPETAPLVVVDLGYSATRSSCGVTWTGRGESSNHRFGVAINRIQEALIGFRNQNPVLVVEAPLSGCHNDRGNPCRRGAFERGREWYCQPAASVCLASLRLLDVLAHNLSDHFDRVLIAEAFLSNKPAATVHSLDASQILEDFWNTSPESVDSRAQPISPLIDGVPQVYVFRIPYHDQ